MQEREPFGTRVIRGMRRPEQRVRPPGVRHLGPVLPPWYEGPHGGVLRGRGPRCLEHEAQAARVIVGFGAAPVRHNMPGFATTVSSKWWRERMTHFGGIRTLPINEYNTSIVGVLDVCVSDAAVLPLTSGGCRSARCARVPSVSETISSEALSLSLRSA